MAFKLTKSQFDAIYDRSDSILISAGAGSGKTSVLAQRVAALAAEGADVSRMLICTFTSPAAAEMRSRISAQLFSLADERNDRRLAAQAETAQFSDICTIHRFALKLIKEQAVPLGLPSDIRVLGERTELIRLSALDDAMEELYEKDDPDLLFLRERFSGRDDEALRNMFLTVYNALRSKEEGLDWLRSPKKSDLDVLLSRQIRSLLLRAQNTLKVCRELSEKNMILDQLPRDDDDLNYIELLLRADVRELQSVAASGKVQSISRKKFPSDELKKSIQYRKKDARALIKSAAALSVSDISGELTYTGRTTDALRSVLKAFDTHYAKAKREKSAVDFDDILYIASDALSRPEIASQYADRYEHVFIDEYQDTNTLQESLLGKIGASNAFMVGDVKQAIYRFRLAAPEIFLEKSRRGAGKVIHMNENFRSNAGVIAAVNHVMSCIMSMELGEMEYTDEQHLRARGDFSGGAELLLTQPNGEESAAAEAKTIAARILELVGSIVTYRGEPRVLQFGDFAVLMRSPKTHSRTFYQVFEECGIPASVQTGSANGLFEPEVFVNLLRIIDGARSDIALLSVLKSHIGAFSDEEIAQIRAYSDSERFSDCLAEYLESEPSPLKDKITSFSERLNRWRLMSHGMPARRLIAALRSETDYDAFVRALPGGARRLTLLEKFFEKLNSLADECTCLFELVEDLDRLKREKGAYFDLPGELNDDRVRIMSIHKSKGLEFPVVILAQMNKSFNQRDLSAKLLFHPELGAACDIIDPERKTEDKSKIKLLLAEDLKAKNKSEELRILYVAMTRAANMLIFSGTCSDPDSLFRSLSSMQRDDMPALSSHLDWVLASLLRLSCFSDWNESACESPEISIPHRICAGACIDSSQHSGRTLEQCLETAIGMSVTPLPVMPRASVPSKVGVSTLLGSLYDTELIPAPAADRRKKDGGAELGTLVHLFMLHLDYKARTAYDVRAQMDALVSKQIFSKSEAGRVMRFANEIARYLNSELAYRIRNSGSVMREIPFTLAVNANELGISDSSEQTLVQGIIDLAFEENGRLIIVDYKTNHILPDEFTAFCIHYKKQLDLYEKALRIITKKPVSAKYLYLIREGQGILV